MRAWTVCVVICSRAKPSSRIRIGRSPEDGRSPAPRDSLLPVVLPGCDGDGGPRLGRPAGVAAATGGASGYRVFVDLGWGLGVGRSGSAVDCRHRVADEWQL